MRERVQQLVIGVLYRFSYAIPAFTAGVVFAYAVVLAAQYSYYSQPREEILPITSIVVTPHPGSTTEHLSGISISPTVPSSANFLVNINTATQAQLDSLPGIGPVLADRIIQHRPFTSIAQLKNVSGIGTKKYQAIQDFVTVE